MKKWLAKTSNGDSISEDDINWELIKDKVTSLCLSVDGQIIQLPDNMKYTQGKTASALLGSGKIEIESRFLGFQVGNKIVKIRVNEKNNNISIEVEHDPNNIFNTKQK